MTPPPLDRLCVLGRLGAQVGGHLVTPRMPGRRAELVFAYLAVEHRRCVTRDELADALWPESLPGAWAAGLRGIVSDVRQVLADCGLAADDLLVSAQGGYALRLPEGVGTDLDAARSLVEAADERLAAGDPAGSVARAGEALALAQLGFLPALEGEWVDGVRREVEVLARRALAAAARGRGAVGDHRGAVAAAEQLVRADPFDETAHQLRIRLHGEAGDRAGARVAYDECVAVLRGELGAEPSAATEEALRLALAAGPPAAAAPKAPEVPARVLVVEDHEFQRRTAAKVLRGLGVTEVLEAANGVEALALLARTDAPDVILCDVDMPGMDGVELVRRIGEQGVTSSVIITSALDPSVLRAVEAVGSGYGLCVLGSVGKPLSARRLGDVLARHSGVAGPAVAGGEGGGAEFERALRGHDLAVAYEPVVDLATGRPCSALAVVVDRETAAPLPAAAVAPALGRPDTAARFVDQLVTMAGAAVSDWRASGHEVAAVLPLPAAVQADVSMVDRVSAAVEATGAPASTITWDVDGAAVRRDPTTALDVLTRLRLRGFGLSLRVASLGAPTADVTAGAPVTEVRFAGGLVAGTPGSAARRDLLERAVHEARDAGLVAAAGGCDTVDHFDLLLSIGCERIHGRYVAGPMPPAEVPAWAARWVAGA